jgi:hypothetical protein
VPPAPLPAPVGNVGDQVIRTIEFATPQTITTVTQFVPQPRFQFQIAPDTSLENLLPAPPRVKNPADPFAGDDLAMVPEVEFQVPLARNLANQESLRKTAHQIAKINFLNAKKTDGFLEALCGKRGDLAGLPFAMGDACRTKGERSKQFTRAVATVRNAIREVERRQAGIVGQAIPAPASVNLGLALPAAIAQPPSPPPASFVGPVLPPAPPAPAVPQPAPMIAPPPNFVGPVPPAPAVPQPAPMIVQGSNVVLTGFIAASGTAEPPSPDKFWERYKSFCAEEDKSLPQGDNVLLDHVTVARIAALMQILAPQAPAMRLGLVKYLAAVSHPEATRALAKLAIFSSEDQVRQAAIDALKVRRERDYTSVLLSGLRYPLPAVARRASDALVKLERADLVNQLVDLLDQPDPRAPQVAEVDNKRVPVVREVVRINHHRNCLLCHAPGNTPGIGPNVLTAAVPVPDQPLPSSGEGYDQSSPDVNVRLDVTYLRQDFSILQPVADANPWPEMQRFDFLVRTRELTEKEAAAYREKFAKDEPGRPSPYKRAALVALRELTGRDTEPSAQAWRQLLGLSTKN